MKPNSIKVENEASYCPFNPGYLKLLLYTKGMRISNDIAGEIENTLKTRRGVAGGVELILPGDVWVNVPTEDEFAALSPLCLIKKDNKYYITGYSGPIRVELVPHHSFYDNVTSKGTPYYQVGLIHGGYVHITPSNKCRFFDFSKNCTFCLERGTYHPDARETITVEEVIEIIEVAFRDKLADSVELNVGYIDSDDRGIAFLEPYIKAVKRNFDTLVAVDIQPPKTNDWIDRTYAMGVDKVSYHMEIFDKEIFARLCPGKSRLIGWERFAGSLEYAAEIFQSGMVSSNLIVGLEPPSSTIKGIDFLTEIGVLPILPVFKPLKGTAHENTASPDVNDIIPIFGHLYNAVKRKNINMIWSKNISTEMTPLEGRYFTDDDAKIQVAMHNIYKSKIGGKAARGLAGLRRRLKVKGGG